MFEFIGSALRIGRNCNCRGTPKGTPFQAADIYYLPLSATFYTHLCSWKICENHVCEIMEWDHAEYKRNVNDHEQLSH